MLDDHCRKTADEINARVSAKSVIPLHLDVTRAADWRAAVETCQREFGGLDVLVNNAGIISGGGIEETTEEEWDAVVNVNQKGVWLGMKYAVPAMRQRGAGSIINISSIYGLIGSGSTAAYHGTKGAVRLLTKTAAIQYAPEKSGSTPSIPESSSPRCSTSLRPNSCDRSSMRLRSNASLSLRR